MIEWNQQDRILDQIQSVFSHFQEAVKKDKDVLVFSSRLSHVGPASRSGNKQALTASKFPSSRSNRITMDSTGKTCQEHVRVTFHPKIKRILYI